MKPLLRTLSLAFTTITLLSMAGCAAIGTSSSADVYKAGQAQREQTVRMGTVQSVRPVVIDTSGDNPGIMGTIGGAALGGIAGSTIGGGKGSDLTAIAGALGGAVAGQAVEKSMSKKDGLEITVKLDNGDVRAIAQQVAKGETFNVGERVKLVSDGAITRVTH